MAFDPVHYLEARGSVQGDTVAVEEVGHHDEVSFGGELVCDESGIDEVVPNHVCEDENCILGGFVGWVDEVG